jgi:predicted DNA-binding transcriptional regulator AlpA
MDNKAVSLKTLSTKYEISVSTLRSWLRKKQLPGAFKLNRLIRIDLKEFDDWVKARQIP